MAKALYSLNSKLEKLSKEESECTIYRVLRHLRNVNSGAYEPKVIAIGPYHHDKDHLKMMENHKLRNLHSLVNRLDSKAYAAAVSSVESSKARKCYADHQDFKLTDDEFIEMLVLDGCFIVELVRKFADGCLGEKGDDPIFGMEWMITSLRRDLMLFENQIPFFVLRNLFHHVKGPNETRTLLQLLTNFFSKLYPAGKGEVLLQVDDDHKIKHLLDLIHRNWVLPRLQQLNKDKKCQKPNPARTMYGMPLQEMKENEVVLMSSMPVQDWNESEIVLGSMPVQERKENEDMTGSMPLQDEENEVEMGSGTPLQDEENEVEMGSGNKENILFINYATELTEANVEFEMEKKDTLFDVYFKDGVMVMPPLHIEDGTECFLRNLIVYEQYFPHQFPHTVVTDYMKLLDNLIDSAKDVEILSRKGIITHVQGDDEVVADMVNRLGDLASSRTCTFSYATMFGEVNEHCRSVKEPWEKRWNRWMATLRRDYLNTPWRIISIIAAVVLLLLTATQTVFSILQVVQEN